MIISTSNLGKRFNREWIFKGLTTQFSTGNIYAITGPNGSGKSTLMRVLWGQEPQSEGKIQYEVDGKQIPAEEIYQHISIVTPYMELIEELSILEHLEFHYKFKKTNANLGMQSIIEKLEFRNAIDKPIKLFSSGMKQRLKLGLGFFSSTEILFLDEPTTNLDEKTIQWYFEKIREIQSKKLVFIATNQPSDYPKGSLEINLGTLKPVTNGSISGIQTI